MKFNLLLSIFLVAILSACNEKAPTLAEQICQNKYANIMVKKEPLYVRTACQQDELSHGLKNIKKMDYDVGMLFVFGYEKELSFWMKDTYIPLDIAFLNDKLQIVDIKTMKPLDETEVKSSQPASYALEVNKGYFKKYDIKVGDTISIVNKVSN
jgi:uncharacterized protein